MIFLGLASFIKNIKGLSNGCNKIVASCRARPSLSSTVLSANTQTLEQRIKALEAQLSKQQTKANVATASTQTEADQQRVENHFGLGKGFRIAETTFGVTDLSIYLYPWCTLWLLMLA